MATKIKPAYPCEVVEVVDVDFAPRSTVVREHIVYAGSTATTDSPASPTGTDYVAGVAVLQISLGGQIKNV
jgi:hypothetical protein